MIIIDSDLVLATVDAVQGTPWIGYDNKVTAGNLSSTTALAQFPVINLADPATHTFWNGQTNAADEYVTVSSLPVTPIDYLAVARHNFGDSQAAISVEARSASNSPPTGWFELVQQQIVPDNSPVLFRWAPQILTDVRLRIAAGGIFPPFAAVIYTGKLLVMERGLDIQNPHDPIKFSRVTNIVSGMSESGNFLGRIVTGSYRESKAEFAHITPAFYRASIDPFIAASKLTPFFWVWNPGEYPGEVGYAWLVNEPVPATSPVTRRVAVEFQMRGIA